MSYFYRALSILGSASAIARIGAMITPYIAQVLVDISLFYAIGVYAVMGKFIIIFLRYLIFEHSIKKLTDTLHSGVIAVIVSFLLPIESKGLDLSETGHQMTKGRVQLVNENDAGGDYGAIETNNDNVQAHDLPERY